MEFNSGFLLPRWLLRLPTCIVGGSTLHNHPVDFIFYGMSQNRKQRSKWSNSRSSRGSRALKRTSPGDVAVATPMCLAFADTLCKNISELQNYSWQKLGWDVFLVWGKKSTHHLQPLQENTEGQGDLSCINYIDSEYFG